MERLAMDDTSTDSAERVDDDARDVDDASGGGRGDAGGAAPRPDTGGTAVAAAAAGGSVVLLLELLPPFRPEATGTVRSELILTMVAREVLLASLTVATGAGVALAPAGGGTRLPTSFGGGEPTNDDTEAN